MRIALLSDIHSNKYALEKAIEILKSKSIDHCYFLGDTFGYYPWALDTYNLLKNIPLPAEYLLGNHDLLIRDLTIPDPKPDYYSAILQNRNELPKDGLAWLNSLEPSKNINIDGYKLSLFHGSPDDPLYGRFYPDNKNTYDWFPNKNELIIMGHTHYPLFLEVKSGGWIINPGSVGQPRKKGSNPSIAILQLPDFKLDIIDFSYDVKHAIAELEKINWYPRAIDSLKKSLLL